MISPRPLGPISTFLRGKRSSISGARLGHGHCYRRSSGGLHGQDVYMRRRIFPGWLGGIGVWWPTWSEQRRGQHRRGSRNSRFRRQHGWNDRGWWSPECQHRWRKQRRCWHRWLWWSRDWRTRRCQRDGWDKRVPSEHMPHAGLRRGLPIESRLVRLSCLCVLPHHPRRNLGRHRRTTGSAPLAQRRVARQRLG